MPQYQSREDVGCARLYAKTYNRTFFFISMVFAAGAAV